jgi:hypothetical protein
VKSQRVAEADGRCHERTTSMKFSHSVDWRLHHHGDDTLEGLEEIVRKALTRVPSITKRTAVKIMTGVQISEQEPALHVLVEIDRGFACTEETYVYVVAEGCHVHGWDGYPPVPTRIARTPSALMKAG